ncbi:ABC transporter G family member 31 [Glycine soja]|nr:ABC transporter G family member 31 [Glycine soja]
MAASDGSEYFEIGSFGSESFARASNADMVREDEEELQWVALSRLPSQKRINYALLRASSSRPQPPTQGTSTGTENLMDVRKLSRSSREQVVKKALATNDQDNYRLLAAIKERFDRVGLKVPKIEVRYKNLSVTADVQIGSRALPTLINYTRDVFESILTKLMICRPKRHSLTILNDVSGVIKPGSYSNLKSGRNVMAMSSRVMTLLLGPPGAGKTSLLLALAGKLDSNLKTTGSITYNGHELDEFYVRRTSAYISQTDDHIAELTVRETLDFGARCQGAKGFAAYTDELGRREIERNIRPSPEVDAFMKASSVGGKKHSVNTDYILKVLGLDICSDTIVGNDMLRGVSGGQRKRVTTVKCIRNFVHQMEATVLMALLQPAPETFELFDDLVLLAEGHVVYEGPREDVLEFFQSLGFQLPPRKGIADFLQEVTSKKDQAQYWADPSKPYQFVSVAEIARAFRNSKYGSWILRVPYSIIEAIIWTVVVYYSVGFAPSAGRFFRYMLILFVMHQMALGLFRMMAAIARDMVLANTYGSASLLVVFLLGGFIVPKGMIKPWWIWGYWVSPLTYGQRAITVNEFTASRWMKKSETGNSTVGYNILHSNSLPTGDYWYWIGIAVLIGYAFFFNNMVTVALTYLNPIQKARTVIPSDDDSENSSSRNASNQAYELSTRTRSAREDNNKGMILPFQPLTMTFHNVNYFVDMPKELSKQGIPETRLQLLSSVSGVFSPGVLTALVGSSGAGKTTLMDVLAGRKTGGYIEGEIKISGHPKEQRTFARISGYVEQNDIHSPQVTIEESLLFSSSLRLPKEVGTSKRHEFVEQVMKLVELDTLRHALIGMPGSSGLSTEQRKRLTIAVELVANPSIIFMDEPTSGLDARAAAIVMRAVRNTVDTGRTVVCTIHQPSIDIFEAFDEGIRGIPPIPSGYNPATWVLEVTTPATEERIGEDFADIYKNSDQYRLERDDTDKTVFFENGKKTMMGVEYSVLQFGHPPAGSEPLKFDTIYSQNLFNQFLRCLWKQNLVYWRSPAYNAMRLYFTTISALIFGTIFWDIGSKRESTQELFVVMGALYSACMFLGVNNASSVQPIVSIERTVFYREKAAGMYSPIAYAAAQGLIEIPYIAVQTVLFGVITYFMINFERTPGKFFLYLVFMFLTFTYFTFYGMMAVGLTPSQHLAAVISSAFYSLWNLLSGFLIPKSSIPGWWIWFYYICPIAWTLRGIITSQLGDVETKIIGPGFEGTVKEYLVVSLGFETKINGFSAVGLSVIVLLGFIILFFGSFAVSVKLLNFQKR